MSTGTILVLFTLKLIMKVMMISYNILQSSHTPAESVTACVVKNTRDSVRTIQTHTHRLDVQSLSVVISGLSYRARTSLAGKLIGQIHLFYRQEELK